MASPARSITGCTASRTGAVTASTPRLNRDGTSVDSSQARIASMAALSYWLLAFPASNCSICILPLCRANPLCPAHLLLVTTFDIFGVFPASLLQPNTHTHDPPSSFGWQTCAAASYVHFRQQS